MMAGKITVHKNTRGNSIHKIRNRTKVRSNLWALAHQRKEESKFVDWEESNLKQQVWKKKSGLAHLKASIYVSEADLDYILHTL